MIYWKTNTPWNFTNIHSLKVHGVGEASAMSEMVKGVNLLDPGSAPQFHWVPGIGVIRAWKKF